MPTHPQQSPRSESQQSGETPHPNPSRNPFDTPAAQAQRKEQSMAAEAARQSARQPHIDQANVPFKQPGTKSHNG